MRPKCKIIISPGWRTRLQEAGLATMQEVYDQASGKTVTRSGSTQVLRVPLSGGEHAEAVYVKKYWFDTARRRFRGMFRETLFGTSKARREYENLLRLENWGIHAPTAVAYGEERRGGWLCRSFLVSAEVPRPTGLDAFLACVIPTLPPEERRRRKTEVVFALADQTRAMHSRRFAHHDYFWRNILLSGGCLDRFYVIDAHNGRCWKSGESMAGRILDLASLDAPAPWFVSRTDRLRFFLRYRNETRLSQRSKTLARQILRLASPMRRRQLKRVRRCLPSAQHVFASTR